MSDNEVLFEINADDNASPKLDNAAEKVESMGGRMSSAMKGAEDSSKKFALALAGIGAAAIAFGVVAFNAYNEAEAAQKQLEHAVLNVSKATVEQLHATEDLADALQKKGVLDGDNIKTGLAQLSTFGLSNDAVRGLGGSLADLAVNQFGVKASGEQLTQTANMMAKALQGQFGVLEKSGIRFTEAQQAIIMTGTEMEKVAAINEGFAQNLKYTNEVAMQTGEGLMAHLGVQLGDIQEAFGKMVSDGITPVIQAFSKWLDSFGGADALIQALIAKIAVLQPYWPLIAGAIVGMLVPAFAAMAVSAWAAVAPLIPFAVAGAAVAAVAYLIYEAYQTNFMGFRDIVTQVIEAITPILGQFRDFFILLGQGIVAAVQLIGFMWETNMYGVRDIAMAVWNALTTFFTGVFEILKGIFKIALGIITLDWKMVWSGIQNVAKGIWDMIVGAAGLFWEGLKLVFKAGGELLSLAWSGFMSGIQTIASGVWEGVKGVFVAGINWIIDKMNSFIRGMSAVTGAIGKVIGQKNWSIPEIPRLAKGGIVTSPTIAMIGEAGPEAVVPLSKGGAGTGFGGMTFIFKDNTFMGTLDEVAEAVGNAIVEKVSMHTSFPKY